METLEYYFPHMDEFPLPQVFAGCQYPHQVLAAIRPFLDEKLSGVQEMHGTLKNGGGVTFYGNYYVGEGTVLYNDVTIIGPVYIGKNCEILPGAILRPYTILGDGCNVGHGSEVKHTLMMNGSKVASLAFAGDCILGKSARMGSGVISANRRFDQKNAMLTVDGVRHDLGDSFFGCILGDSSRLGANCVTQPGTHIGPYTWVFPLTNVRGFIPAQKRVYHTRDIVMEDQDIVELH